MDSSTIGEKQVREKKIAEAFRVLRTYVFRTKISPEAEAKAEQVQLGNPKARCVYSVGDRWMVKYFVAGKQRVFGFFDGYDYAAAYRLADMVVHFFNDKRIRKPKPLTADSYNLTIAQVKADMENENEIKSCFHQIDALTPERSFAPPRPQTKKTAHAEFSKMVERIANIESLLEEQSNRLHRQNENLVNGLVQIHTRFNEIKACIGNKCSTSDQSDTVPPV